MSRLLVIGLVAVVLTGLWGTDAMAQRDAGAKARGDMRSFWDPSYPRTGGPSSFYQPARPSSDTYRSFSYEPLGVSAGDTVVVTSDNAKMMRGAVVVGSVPNGLKFKVTKVVGGWLGTVVDVNGQNLNGWVWHTNVTADE